MRICCISTPICLSWGHQRRLEQRAARIPSRSATGAATASDSWNRAQRAHTPARPRRQQLARRDRRSTRRFTVRNVAYLRTSSKRPRRAFAHGCLGFGVWQTRRDGRAGRGEWLWATRVGLRPSEQPRHSGEVNVALARLLGRERAVALPRGALFEQRALFSVAPINKLD